MDTRRRFAALTLASLAWAAGAAAAQSPPAAITQAPPQAPAPPGPGDAKTPASRPTLIAEPGDPGNADEVTLPEKPVLILAGEGQWEDAFNSLKAALGKVEAELAKQGIAPAGRPLATFNQTTDDAFKFEAMIPIAAAPSPVPTLPAGMRFGTTFSGKTYRFVHKGSYDDIDATYDTVTTYLEAKDIAAKDVFMEEFVTDVPDGADPNLEVNIFVQPK